MKTGPGIVARAGGLGVSSPEAKVGGVALLRERRAHKSASATAAAAEDDRGIENVNA